MGIEVRIEPATLAHAEELARTMRQADADELEALGYATRLDALVQPLQARQPTWALLFGGAVAAMFGVAHHDGPTMLGERKRVAWVLTGEPVTRHPITFAKASRKVLAALLDAHGAFENWVDARYAASVRWLQWLGCELGEPVQFPSGVWFRPVTFRRT